MQRKVYILIFLLMCGTFVKAQTVDELIRRAYVKYDEKEYLEAATEIDHVVSLKKGESNVLAWHIRGFIYKDIYKKLDNANPDSEARDISVQSFLRSYELDVENELKEKTLKSLQVMAASYFNDAADVIEARDPATIEKAEGYFQKYSDITKLIETEAEMKEKEILYFLAMATAHRKIYEKDREKHAKHYEISNSYYLKVLEIDPNDFSANYSLAVTYYNRGAQSLEKLPELEIHDVVKIQGESIRSIQFALPFMLKAYEVNPDRIEAVKGLKYILFNLHDYEESEFYDEQLQILEKEKLEK